MITKTQTALVAALVIGSASTAFAARAFLKAVAAVTVFAVGGMMVSHFFLLCVVFRYSVRYIL